MREFACSRHRCDATGPATAMYVEVDDAEVTEEGTWVQYAPVCAAHVTPSHPMDPDEAPTLADALDMGRRVVVGEPSDADLDEWIAAHGAADPEFLGECAEVAELPPTITSVPYGDTFVNYYASVDPDAIPGGVQLHVAGVWWERGRLDWVPVFDNDGEAQMVLRDTSKEQQR